MERLYRVDCFDVLGKIDYNAKVSAKNSDSAKRKLRMMMKSKGFDVPKHSLMSAFEARRR